MASRTQFSVALCTYNGEHFLREQLDSLARQDLLPAELIVCDDGSTDDTVAIVEAFARSVPFRVVTRRNERNLGYAANFRQALKLCSQELIALCDQDDRWRPDKLSTLETVFARGGETVGGVFSDGALMNGAGQPREGSLWSSFRFPKEAQARWVKGRALEELVRRNVVTGMTLALRRRWVGLMDSLPSSWHHDAWLALRLADESYLMPCPEKLVTYRLHDKQQVGVPVTKQEKILYLRTHGLGGYLKQVRERNERDYATASAAFQDLLQSLQAQNLVASPRLCSLAQGKTAYAIRGLHLLTLERWRRWPHVLRHAREYGRYSPTGWPAAVRDLLL